MTSPIAASSISEPSTFTMATEKEVDKVLIKGNLRKKGLFFNNERYVTISEAGLLRYYHLDKPDIAKGNIDLKS